MEAEQPEVISAEPSRFASKGPRLIGVAVVLVVLAVVAVAAARHHGASAAPRQQPPPAARQLPALTRLPTVASAIYSLADGPVAGEVTVFSVRFARGTEQIVLAAHLTGARPHTRYELIGIDCSAAAETDRAWASGTSDAHGIVQLTGPGWTVYRGDFYALGLSPSRLQPAPGLHGYLGTTGLYAFPRGNAPCSP